MVPAGGSSRRMGTDKLAEPLGASTVLGELLSRVPPGVPVAVVGPLRDLPARSPAVIVVREDPPGGGPAAAVAAGLSALEGADGALHDVDVVVCAGDAPWSPLAVPALVSALRSATLGTGCAVAVDTGGRRQPLLAVHRLDHLRERSAPEGVVGRPARWLLGSSPLEVAVPERLLADVDTPEQLAAARERC